MESSTTHAKPQHHSITVHLHKADTTLSSRVNWHALVPLLWLIVGYLMGLNASH